MHAGVFKHRVWMEDVREWRGRREGHPPSIVRCLSLGKIGMFLSDLHDPTYRVLRKGKVGIFIIL